MPDPQLAEELRFWKQAAHERGKRNVLLRQQLERAIRSAKHAAKKHGERVPKWVKDAEALLREEM